MSISVKQRRKRKALSVKREREAGSGEQRYTTDTVPRIILRRPGSAENENIIDLSSLPDCRCAVRLSNKWHLGTVVRINSAVDVEVRLDNGRHVSGDPHDADFRTLD